MHQRTKSENFFFFSKKEEENESLHLHCTKEPIERERERESSNHTLAEVELSHEELSRLAISLFLSFFF